MVVVGAVVVGGRVTPSAGGTFGGGVEPVGNSVTGGRVAAVVDGAPACGAGPVHATANPAAPSRPAARRLVVRAAVTGGPYAATGAVGAGRYFSACLKNRTSAPWSAASTAGWSE